MFQIIPRTEPLSAIPSEAIFQAVRDLEAVESDRRYRVDMEVWHAPSVQQHACRVCMAGAVLAHRIGDPKVDAEPYQDEVPPAAELGRDELARIRAFDSLRAGDYEDFLDDYLDPDVTRGLQNEFLQELNGSADPMNHVFQSYGNNPIAFKQHLRTFAEFLQAKGH